MIELAGYPHSSATAVISRCENECSSKYSGVGNFLSLELCSVFQASNPRLSSAYLFTTAVRFHHVNNASRLNCRKIPSPRFSTAGTHSGCREISALRTPAIEFASLRIRRRRFEPREPNQSRHLPQSLYE